MAKVSYDLYELGSYENELSLFDDFVSLLHSLIDKAVTPAFVIEIDKGTNGKIDFGVFNKMGFLTHTPYNSIPPYKTSLNSEFANEFPNNDDVYELHFPRKYHTLIN